MTRLGESEIPRLGDCALVCVDPARAREVWPFVETTLARAYMSGLGDETIDDVRDDVFANRALLWLVWDETGKAILAAGTTKLIDTKRGKVCLLTSVAGRDIGRWRDFIHEIENYAKVEGCIKLRAYGRAGWERMLKGYIKPWITIEKSLIEKSRISRDSGNLKNG